MAGTVVIDARDKVFYDGVQSGGDRNGPPLLGHIPGAGSIPFGDVFDDKGFVEPAATLAELFKQAGVKPGDEVIAYCHIGQQATAVVFAARTLGYKVRLYDGSMNDWSLRGLPYRRSDRTRGSARAATVRESVRGRHLPRPRAARGLRPHRARVGRVGRVRGRRHECGARRVA